MRHKRIKLSTILLIGLGLSGVQAQEAIPAGGGEATGNGGSVSYTVGQVVYTAQGETTGTVSQGVQQAYKIEVITELEEALDIRLEASVYPNPTTDRIQLDVGDYIGGELKYRLFSETGVLLGSKDISGRDIHIAMSDLGPATYLLRVLEGSKPIKTFKIIKQ